VVPAVSNPPIPPGTTWDTGCWRFYTALTFLRLGWGWQILQHGPACTYVWNKGGFLDPSFQSFPIEALEEFLKFHFMCPRSAEVTSEPLVWRLFQKLSIRKRNINCMKLSPVHRNRDWCVWETSVEDYSVFHIQPQGFILESCSGRKIHAWWDQSVAGKYLILWKRRLHSPWLRLHSSNPKLHISSLNTKEKTG
jgi:hypothetical protein